MHDRTMAIPDPVPLEIFRSRFDVDSLTARTNRQRTSTRGGTSKAHAVLDHVDIFRAVGIETMDQARAIMSDGPAFERVSTPRCRRCPEKVDTECAADTSGC